MAIEWKAVSHLTMDPGLVAKGYKLNYKLHEFNENHS
jgi:hypothetical protein